MSQFMQQTNQMNKGMKMKIEEKDQKIDKLENQVLFVHLIKESNQMNETICEKN